MASDNCETIISSVNVQMARLLSMFTRYILSIYQISIYTDEPIIWFLNERTMIKLIFVTICVDFNYNKHLQIFFHLQYLKFDPIRSSVKKLTINDATPFWKCGKLYVKITVVNCELILRVTRKRALIKWHER